MATTIQFRVPCVPVAQPRQRHRVVSDSVGRVFAQNYTPKHDPVNSYKATVRLAASESYNGPPLKCPLMLHAIFVFPRPKAMQWKKRAMPRDWHAKKPDIDNIYKSLADSLNGILFVDDSQLCLVTLSKRIAAGDEQPHCEIVITELDPPEGGTAGE